MRIYCLNCDGGSSNNGGWGREVNKLAVMRGHKAGMFSRIEDIKGRAYIFGRVAQSKDRCQADKDLLVEAHVRNFGPFIQDLKQIIGYEDKIKQHEWFKDFMPKRSPLVSCRFHPSGSTRTFCGESKSWASRGPHRFRTTRFRRRSPGRTSLPAP